MTKPPHDLKGIAALLAKQGRGGDTMLAHINPQEAALLKSLGGSGTINPNTGLPEYGFFSSLNPFRIVENVTGVDLIGSARSITGGVAGAVESAAQALGNTVEAIVSDPKKLAAVGLMVAFPGAAGAVGDFILGDALAVDALVASGAMTASEAALVGTASLGSGAAASAIVGQAAINAATNGGDVEQAVKAALIQQGLPAALKSDVMRSLNKDMVDVLGKYGAQATTNAGLAAIMGKDPVAAFVFSGASNAVNLITKEIPGWSALPEAAQKSVNSALLADLTGKDAATAAANSLVNSAITFGQKAVQIQKDAVNSGRVLSDSDLQATKNISVPEAQRALELSRTYTTDFADIATAMGSQDNIPDALKSTGKIYKEVGNGLYTTAGGNTSWGPTFVYDKDGNVARLDGTLMLFDSAANNIRTATGTIVDPETGRAQVAAPSVPTDEVTAGTQQLIDAITNPQSTVSYPGTQVADIGKMGDPGSGVYWDSSIGAWRVADEATAEDLDQLGVGLATDPGLTGTGTEPDEEAQLQAELEAQLREQEQARLYAEEQARLQAEEDARRQAEEAARAKAEAEAARAQGARDYNAQMLGFADEADMQSAHFYGFMDANSWNSFNQQDLSDLTGGAEGSGDTTPGPTTPTDTTGGLTDADLAGLTGGAEGSGDTTPVGGGAANDGTTTGIQDIIDSATTGGSLGDESDLPSVDTGGSLGDESDLPSVDTGGSLGDESDLPPTDTEEEPQCAPGFHWNGSMCVADTDVEDQTTTCPEGYIFDLDTQTCVPVGSTDTTKLPTDTTKLPTDTTKLPTDTTKLPTDTTKKSTGLDLAGLLALMGGQQGETITPGVADMSDMVDIETLLANPLQTDYRKLATKPKMAEGGSIDDLLTLLNQKG